MGAIIVGAPKAYLACLTSFLQIGVGISISWGHTIYKEFELLAGKSAPHEFIQLLVYKAATFSDEIDKLDTVRAYHVRTCPIIFRNHAR